MAVFGHVTSLWQTLFFFAPVVAMVCAVLWTRYRATPSDPHEPDDAS